MGWDSIFLFPTTKSELKHMAGKVGKDEASVLESATLENKLLVFFGEKRIHILFTELMCFGFLNEKHL